MPMRNMEFKKEGISKNIKQESENDQEAGSAQFCFASVNLPGNNQLFLKHEEIDIDSSCQSDCKAAAFTCRLCGQAIPSGDLKHHLYEDVPVSLAFQVNFALPVNVQQDDGFSEHVCTTCKSKVEGTFEFAQLVVSVDSQMRFR